MGRGKYGRNVLAGPGITLETVLSNGTVLSPNQLREVGDQVRLVPLPRTQARQSGDRWLAGWQH